MATYEYTCDNCGKQFEKVQKMSDAPVAVCPECGSEKTHRMISATSFVLKGSGWYATDYAGKKCGSGSSSGSTSEKPAACCGCESGSCSH